MKLSPAQIVYLKESQHELMNECGCCGEYHPIDFIGDCRNDDFRYHPDDMGSLLITAPDLLYHLYALLEILPDCECDNTHKQNNTKCRICFAKDAIQEATK